MLLGALHTQVCSVGRVGAPLGDLCVLELLLSPRELPWAVATEELMGLLPSFSAPLLGQAVVAGD